MPASHACCRVPSQSETLVVHGQASLPLKHAIAAVPAIIQVSLPDALAVLLRSLAFFESPPGPPPSCSSSVLRI
jgi:hypothetical protein